jgi:hypothetical protein
VISCLRVGDRIRRFHLPASKVLSPDVDCAHNIPVAFILTLGTVEVPAVATFCVVVGRAHRPATLTTPGAVSTGSPRIHCFHVDPEQFSLVLDKIEQLATRPRRNRPCHSTPRLTTIELAQRLEDNPLTATDSGYPDEFVRNLVLDLLTQAAFFLACLAVLGQQVIESVGVCLALSSQLCQSVVDAFGIGLETEQFRFRRMVEKFGWGNLFVCLLAAVENDRSGLFFHAEIDRQYTG